MSEDATSRTETKRTTKKTRQQQKRTQGEVFYSTMLGDIEDGEGHRPPNTGRQARRTRSEVDSPIWRVIESGRVMGNCPIQYCMGITSVRWMICAATDRRPA